MGSDSNGKAGVGCLILFLLPFCAVGVVTGIMAIWRVLQGTAEWEETVLLGVLSLAFGGAGFGVLYVTLAAQKKQKDIEARKQQYPDSPWMWRKDWADGQVRHSAKSEMKLAWLVSLALLLFSAVLVPKLYEEVLEKDNHVAAVGFLLPLIGLGLLVWAIRATIRWKRFGTSVIQMSSVPGIIGGPVAGTIQTSLRELPGRGFELRLRSIHRTVSGSGKNSSTKEKILWQEEQRVKKEELFPGYLGTSARFSFHIPGDCRPTDQEDSRSSILWTLQVTADIPGVDYDATFDIPVFRTEQSSATSTGVIETMRRVSGEELLRLRRDSKIRISTRPDSGKEIYFPAARNPGMAAGLTLFFLIWSGFIWLMLHLGAPKIFPILFGVFWLLIFFGVLDMWFGTSRLIVHDREFVVKSGFFGIGRRQTFLPSEIKDVKTKIGTQSGGRSGTPFYDLYLVRRSGRDVLIGRYIKHKREAEWLIGEVKDSLEAAQV